MSVRLTDTGKVVKRLRTQNKKRLKRRMKGQQRGCGDGRLEWEDVKRSLAASNGHLIRGPAYRLRAEIYRDTAFIRKNGEESLC